MKNVYVLIIISLTSFDLFAIEEKKLTLPEGWRFVKHEEMKEEWRDKSLSLFTAQDADYDGDKKIDHARFLISTDGKKYGIFVWWGNENFKMPFPIHFEKDGFGNMGIMKAQKDKYRTACGKGYYACKKNEPADLNLENESLDYFKEGSGNSFFHYDKIQKMFLRTWMSN
jgi:hypothetical protein